MHLPVSICEFVWAGMLYEFHQSIAHLDPSRSTDEYEEYWYQLEQCAPDDQDYQYELDYVQDTDDFEWVTPSLVL